MVIDVDTVLRSSVNLLDDVKSDSESRSLNLLDMPTPSPEMFQAPQTFMDIERQFLGSSPAARHQPLAHTCELPQLFINDTTNPRHEDWTAPELPQSEIVNMGDIHLVSGNDFKRFYAKSYFSKPHALYIGQGAAVKSVIIAVRPKIHKATGLRASLRPQDFASAKASHDFASIRTTGTTLSPASLDADAFSLPEDDTSVYVLIFSQYGTWRTVLSLDNPSGFRSKFAPKASKTKSFPSPSVLKAALHKERPDLKLDKLSRIEETLPVFSAFSKQLLYYEDRTFAKGHKFGLIYCKKDQTKEEDMFRNLHEEASPSYLQFLEWIGQKITLEGWPSYAGGLDTKRNTTGKHSIWSTVSTPTLTDPNPEDSKLEIIFHVPTLMPFFPDDAQAVERKRHVGNDIVTLVFQDNDAPPFCPTSIMTTFTHVYIVVREIAPETYHVGVISRHNVPEFGPPLPSAEVFRKDHIFRKWLLYKLVNAERASLYHPTFRTLMCQSRKKLLEELI